MSSKQQANTSILVLGFLLLVLVLATLTLLSIWFSAHRVASRSSEGSLEQVETRAIELAGQIGDRFGAVNALVSGSALLLIGWSLVQSNRSIDQVSSTIELQGDSLLQTKEAVAIQKQELEEHRKEFILNRVTNVIYRQVAMVNEHGRQISHGQHQGVGSASYVIQVSDGKPVTEDQKKYNRKKNMAFFNGNEVSVFIKKLDDTITLCSQLMATNDITQTDADQLWLILHANLDDVIATHTLTSLTNSIQGAEAKRLESEVKSNPILEFTWKFHLERRDRAKRVENWISLARFGREISQ